MTKSAHIAINWLFGRPANGAEDDEARAASAAAAVLGNDAFAAQAEYLQQWEEFDDENKMTGLALLFIKARQAADVALTEGWYKPDEASCDIEVW